MPSYGYDNRESHKSDGLGEDEWAGKTFRMWPQHFAAEAGNFQNLRCLINEAFPGFDTNTAVASGSFHGGDTVLHLVCRAPGKQDEEVKEVLTWLMGRGADKMRRNDRGRTCADLTEAWGSRAVFEFLGGARGTVEDVPGAGGASAGPSAGRWRGWGR